MRLETLKEEPAYDAHSTPILFMHGMSHAAWCWAVHFLPYFTQHGYVSHALSLRGHGGSEGRKRLRWTSLSEYVSDVAQVVGQMERPPVLVGHSMGGMIVQKYLESNCAPAAVLLASAPPKGVVGVTLRVVSSASPGIRESQPDDEHAPDAQHAATGTGGFVFSRHAKG